jgi:hypothetical protein
MQDVKRHNTLNANDVAIQRTFVANKRDASRALEIMLPSNIQGKQDLRMLNVQW